MITKRTRRNGQPVETSQQIVLTTRKGIDGTVAPNETNAVLDAVNLVHNFDGSLSPRKNIVDITPKYNTLRLFPTFEHFTYLKISNSTVYEDYIVLSVLTEGIPVTNISNVKVEDTVINITHAVTDVTYDSIFSTVDRTFIAVNLDLTNVDNATTLLHTNAGVKSAWRYISIYKDNGNWTAEFVVPKTTTLQTDDVAKLNPDLINDTPIGAFDNIYTNGELQVLGILALIPENNVYYDCTNILDLHTNKFNIGLGFKDATNQSNLLYAFCKVPPANLLSNYQCIWEASDDGLHWGVFEHLHSLEKYNSSKLCFYKNEKTLLPLKTFLNPKTTKTFTSLQPQAFNSHTNCILLYSNSVYPYRFAYRFRVFRNEGTSSYKVFSIPNMYGGAKNTYFEQVGFCHNIVYANEKNSVHNDIFVYAYYNSNTRTPNTYILVQVIPDTTSDAQIPVYNWKIVGVVGETGNVNVTKTAKFQFRLDALHGIAFNESVEQSGLRNYVNYIANTIPNTPHDGISEIYNRYTVAYTEEANDIPIDIPMSGSFKSSYLIPSVDYGGNYGTPALYTLIAENNTITYTKGLFDFKRYLTIPNEPDWECTECFVNVTNGNMQSGLIDDLTVSVKNALDPYFRYDDRTLLGVAYRNTTLISEAVFHPNNDISYKELKTTFRPVDLNTVRSEYIGKRVYMYDNVNNGVVFRSDAGNLCVPYLNNIIVPSGKPITKIVNYQNMLVVFTSSETYIVKFNDTGHTVTTVSDTQGVQKDYADTVQIIQNCIYFVCNNAVYRIYPNLYIGNSELILTKMSDNIEHLLAEFEQYSTKFSFYTTNYYVILYADLDENESHVFRYNFTTRIWEHHRYSCYFNRYSVIENQQICLYSDVNNSTKIYLYDAQENPTDDCNGEDVPIEYELDTGSKTNSIVTTKQFTESKIICTSDVENPNITMHATVIIDGDKHPYEQDISTDGAFTKESGMQSGIDDITDNNLIALTLGTTVNTESFDEYRRNNASNTYNLYLRHSGKGRSVRYILKGVAKSPFRLYEICTRFKNLNVKQ